MTEEPAAILPDAPLSFGKLLRVKRLEKKWTQGDLATQINVCGGDVADGSVIAHWEAEKRRPNGTNLLGVCIALEIDFKDAQYALQPRAEEA